MSLSNKIRRLRQAKGLTQKMIADELNVSKNTYARMERGETALTERKLEKLASVLNISDWSQLKSYPEDKVVLLLAENNTIQDDLKQAEHMTVHYHNGDEQLRSEIEKLTLIIQHKDELLAQTNQELKTIKEMFDLLKQQLKNQQ